MTLQSDYFNGKYIKRFAALGPYLRENQCTGGGYFFDSLTVCINANVAPEKREFWGWWMTLSPMDKGFEYSYYLGMYDGKGIWQPNISNDKTVMELIEKNLISFHQSLSKQLCELGFACVPSVQMAEFKWELST